MQASRLAASQVIMILTWLARFFSVFADFYWLSYLKISQLKIKLSQTKIKMKPIEKGENQNKGLDKNMFSNLS